MGGPYSYILENLLVHSPDALLAGGGYYLIRFTGWQPLGWGMLILYALAIAGSATSGDPFVWWGTIAAVFGVLLAHAIGELRRSKY